MYSFQTVTGFVRKRSSKFLEGFGYRDRKSFERRNRAKVTLDNGTRFALISGSCIPRETAYFKILHLLLVFFCGRMLSWNFFIDSKFLK